METQGHETTALDALASALGACASQDLSFEPVRLTPDEARQLANTDLVSHAEVFTGDVLQPSSLGAVYDRGLGRRCYWLHWRGVRVGTIAFRAEPWRTGRGIEISSLYVAPDRRRQGLARRALQLARQCAQAAGVGLVTLSTSWLAQPALRLYLSSGMWVRSWKDEITLAFDAQAGDWELAECRFVVVGRTPITATRRGARLEWRDHDAGTRPDAQWYAEATLAVALASMGWPLIRDETRWRDRLEHGHGDIGGPEDFACYCRRYEAYARHHGHRVEVPAIPGVEHADWITLHGPRFCPGALERLLQRELSTLEQDMLLLLARIGTSRCDSSLELQPIAAPALAERLGSTPESVRHGLRGLQRAYLECGGQASASFLALSGDPAQIPNFLAADQVHDAVYRARR